MFFYHPFPIIIVDLWDLHTIVASEYQRLDALGQKIVGNADRAFGDQPIVVARNNIRANIELANKYKAEELPGMQAQVKPNILDFELNEVHPECVIQLNIRNDHERTLVTYGFYMVDNNGVNELHINNIQGMYKAGEGEQSPLTGLFPDSPDNWRITIAKSLKVFGEKHGLNVVGDLPGRHVIASSMSEYKRQIRQYRQTFRKAGITEIDESKVCLEESYGDQLAREKKQRERQRTSGSNDKLERMDPYPGTPKRVENVVDKSPRRVKVA